MKKRLSFALKVFAAACYLALVVYLYLRPEVGLTLQISHLASRDSALSSGGCEDPAAKEIPDEQTVRSRLKRIRQQITQQENPLPSPKKNTR